MMADDQVEQFTIISDEAVKHGLSTSALKTASAAVVKKPRAKQIKKVPKEIEID